MQYVQPTRNQTVTARVTRGDRRLLQAAAAARETTVSRYVAQVATEAARRDLLATRGDQASEKVRQEQRA